MIPTLTCQLPLTANDLSTEGVISRALVHGVHTTLACTTQLVRSCSSSCSVTRYTCPYLLSEGGFASVGFTESGTERTQWSSLWGRGGEEEERGGWRRGEKRISTQHMMHSCMYVYTNLHMYIVHVVDNLWGANSFVKSHKKHLEIIVDLSNVTYRHSEITS